MTLTLPPRSTFKGFIGFNNNKNKPDAQAATPPIDQIQPFSKMAITSEPLMRFGCPSKLRKFLITMT